MRIPTALNKRDTAIRSTRDLYSMAYHAGMSHGEMMIYTSKIRDNLAKCPGWCKDYVQGYEAALFARLFESAPNNPPALVFGTFIKGQFYSVHRNRPDYYGKHGIEPQDMPDDGRHHWGHLNPPKPF